MMLDPPPATADQKHSPLLLPGILGVVRNPYPR